MHTPALRLRIIAIFFAGLALLAALLIVGAPAVDSYRHETKELEARFGQAYRDYRQRTPFLIPRRPPRQK